MEDLIDNRMQTAFLGGGCFWCLEAAFSRLSAVQQVESGYMGGEIESPTYQQVCGGYTGHAEVVKVVFDSKNLSYKDILRIFFCIHDPTTLNRQGNDVGPQYRSVIFFCNNPQEKAAVEIIKEMEAAKLYENPLVTEACKAEEFFRAEDYHQGYYDANASQPYCQYVISPKIEKLKKLWADVLR
jgi:peptide-methionine (S)-S-oxide reductase